LAGDSDSAVGQFKAYRYIGLVETSFCNLCLWCGLVVEYAKW